MQIGNKLKELRVQNGLTLEELASRSELTKGFLSQLERDKSSPSISTLEDILEALGTNLSEFFQTKPEEQIVFSQNDFFVNDQEDQIIEWIVPNAQKNEMEPILLTLHAQKKSRIMKANEGQEFGYVLKGPVKLIVDKKVYTLKSKETFYLSNAKTHYFMNPSNHDVKVLWVSNPPMF